MDVRQYYRKLREIEANITEPYVLVTSLETEDGGQAGVIAEVSRELAAKQIVEGRATLATETETRSFLEKQIAGRRAFEKSEMARRLQVTIVSAPDEADAKAAAQLDVPAGVRK